jgi:hypothetical protein
MQRIGNGFGIVPMPDCSSLISDIVKAGLTGLHAGQSEISIQ